MNNKYVQDQDKTTNPWRNKKSIMTREQFGLKNSVLRITFATWLTGTNLKLSTSPSANVITLKYEYKMANFANTNQQINLQGKYWEKAHERETRAKNMKKLWCFYQFQKLIYCLAYFTRNSFFSCMSSFKSILMLQGYNLKKEFCTQQNLSIKKLFYWLKKWQSIGSMANSTLS